MNNRFTNTLQQWHKFIKTPQPEILEEILSDEVSFHSPFVWKPKLGKPMTKQILMTAAGVFENFRYIREIFGEHDWMLEFEASIGELTLRGVDIIKVDDAGKIVDFEVMVRPANALQILGMEMRERMKDEG